MTTKYTKTDEWIKIENNIVTIGLTAHAAEAMGELVYVELPKTGTKFNKGDAATVVESSKAAQDVYTPVTGEVIEVNESLIATPEEVNNSPYQNGWLIKIRISNPSDLDGYMTEAEYNDYLKEHN